MKIYEVELSKDSRKELKKIDKYNKKLLINGYVDILEIVKTHVVMVKLYLVLFKSIGYIA